MIDKGQAQRGGALVEFAVIVPVAMFFLLGIIQTSMLLYTYHAVGNGARLGARFMATHGTTCVNTGTDAQGNTLCPASKAAVQYYIQQQMPGLSTSASNLTISPDWKDTPTTWAHPASGCGSGTKENAGCIATVTVTYKFDLLSGILGLPTTRTITTQSQLIMQ